MVAATTIDLSCNWTACCSQISLSSSVQFHADEIVSAAGGVLRLHHVKSGDLIAQIAAHHKPITSIVMHEGTCYTSSQDGCIHEWDLRSRSQSNTFALGAPITHLAVSGAFFYVVTRAKDDSYSVQRYDRQQRQLHLLVTLARPVKGFALKSDGRTLAATSGRTLMVWRPDGVLLQRKHTQAMVALSFHPFDDYLCTGDVAGRIVLWYGYQLQDDGRPRTCIKSVLHWHAHTFHALQFTDDGTYLLSGGQEQVLVQWQMHDGHKHFLPRLGGRITSITVSPKGDLFAVVCDDNAIRIISAISSRVVTVIDGVLLPSIPDRTKSGRRPKSNPASYKIAGDRANPGRAHVALSVSQSTRLQFFDCISQRSIALLETEPSSVNRGCLSEIASWSQSSNGSWLAVALRSDKSLQANALSFYQWDDFKHGYVARVAVDDHDRTHGVLFHPSRDLCVALSAAQFRLWAVVPSTTRHVATSWAVQHVGQFRNLKPTTVAFSRDGSLLAVAFQDSAVTLWDMNTCELVRAVFEMTGVFQLAFCHRHLVGVSSDSIYSWDCIEAHVSWSQSIHSIVSLSCSNDYAVVASSSGAVSIFRPHQRNPAIVKSLPLVNAVTFVDDGALIGVTRKGTLHRLQFV